MPLTPVRFEELFMVMPTSAALFKAWIDKDWDTYNKLVSQMPFSEATNVPGETVEIQVSSQTGLQEHGEVKPS